jgi:hypothetical protein
MDRIQNDWVRREINPAGWVRRRGTNPTGSEDNASASHPPLLGSQEREDFVGRLTPGDWWLGECDADGGVSVTPMVGWEHHWKPARGTLYPRNTALGLFRGSKLAVYFSSNETEHRKTHTPHSCSVFYSSISVQKVVGQRSRVSEKRIKSLNDFSHRKTKPNTPKRGHAYKIPLLATSGIDEWNIYINK